MNTLLVDDPYQVLGLERDATEAAIKQAYFSLVREHPPEHDPAGFKRIRAAYEKLKASSERAGTDLLLIDDQPLSLDPASLHRHQAEPSPLTRETIRADLLALESIILFEELRTGSASAPSA